jgi:hypothetical protein
MKKTWLPSRYLAMGVGDYATSLTIRYLGSDVSLRSGFNCHNIIRYNITTNKFFLPLFILESDFRIRFADFIKG